MLCENCKEREATVHFTEIMNGRVQKHHLCKECAAQMEMMGYASNEVPFVKLLTGMLAAGTGRKSIAVCTLSEMRHDV